MTAVRPSIIQGEQDELRWFVKGATDVRIDPGIGAVAPEGYRKVQPSESTTFTLTVVTPSGRLTRSVNVLVTPVIAQVEFTVDRETIRAGESDVLRWSVTGSRSQRIEPDIGDVAISSTVSVSPRQDIQYTLTAESANGPVTKTISIHVIAPPPTVADFSATPDRLAEGGSTTIKWSVDGAERVEIRPGVGLVPLQGEKKIQLAQSTQLTLRAQGPGGIVSRNLSIVVSVPPPPAPTITFRADPTQIDEGGRSNLYWSVTGANTIRIEPGIGNVPSSSTIVVAPAKSTSYTLTADGPGGVRESTAAVTVVPKRSSVAVRDEYGSAAQHLRITGNVWRVIVPADHIYHGTGLQLQESMPFLIVPISPNVSYVLRVGDRTFLNQQVLMPGPYGDGVGEVWIGIIEALTNTVEFRVESGTPPPPPTAPVGRVVAANHKHTLGFCQGKFDISAEGLIFVSPAHTVRFTRATIRRISNVAPAGKFRGASEGGWTTVVDTSGKRWDFSIPGKRSFETEAILNTWLATAK